MDADLLIKGLLVYLAFIPVLTFHEFAHAWTAWKCGDDTAKSLGRVSLNPIRHMEVIGTVVLPLFAIYLQMTGSIFSGFIIGWGKPVPVNPANLKHPRLDDSIIAIAGPASNLVLAVLMMGIARVGQLAGSEALIEIGLTLVFVNLILAFFNMLPIPPLDGSHLVKNAIGMSYETYWRLAQFGIIGVIIAINIPGVRSFLVRTTETTAYLIARLYGMGWRGL